MRYEARTLEELEDAVMNLCAGDTLAIYLITGRTPIVQPITCKVRKDGKLAPAYDQR